MEKTAPGRVAKNCAGQSGENGIGQRCRIAVQEVTPLQIKTEQISGLKQNGIVG